MGVTSVICEKKYFKTIINNRNLFENTDKDFNIVLFENLKYILKLLFIE